MKLSLVAAMGENRAIGLHNRMPWHLPADLRRFRRLTWGKPVIMGRRTHESIGRPLPGRKNIVVSGNPDYRAPGCRVVHSLAEALREADAEEAMVIGGATLYRALLPRADRLYLTLIHRPFLGDTFFPEFDPRAFRELERIDVDQDPASGLRYTFLILER
ncbi:dihydrofolate reductase [Candidatus Methylocalor cossyra]|uniref:Dihydrofolate reductase n=1 Tax=Candidatus Methylocalor cossyra TaxID=3108543 RepID=A0ABP1C9Y2_9GAMM